MKSIRPNTPVFMIHVLYLRMVTIAAMFNTLIILMDHNFFMAPHSFIGAASLIIWGLLTILSMLTLPGEEYETI